MTESLEHAAREVLVGIQLCRPPLRSVLISAVDCPGASALGDEVAAAMSSLNKKVRAVTVEISNDHETALRSTLDGLGLESVSRLTDVAYVSKAIEEASSEGQVIATTADFLGLSESRVLAATVDGVVLLAQAGRTREPRLREAHAQIEAVGGTLIGSIYIGRAATLLQRQ